MMISIVMETVRNRTAVDGYCDTSHRALANLNPSIHHASRTITIGHSSYLSGDSPLCNTTFGGIHRRSCEFTTNILAQARGQFTFGSRRGRSIASCDGDQNVLWRISAINVFLLITLQEVSVVIWNRCQVTQSGTRAADRTTLWLNSGRIRPSSTD